MEKAKKCLENTLRVIDVASKLLQDQLSKECHCMPCTNPFHYKRAGAVQALEKLSKMLKDLGVERLAMPTQEDTDDGD